MKEKEIKISLPATWNDLTDAQLERLAILFYSDKKGVDFDLEVFLALMNASAINVKAALQANTVLKQVPLSELKQHYKFVYQLCGRTKFPAALKVGGQTVFPPMDQLMNLSVAEFAAAEGFLQLWEKTKHRRALENLAAVLYCSAPIERPVFNKFTLQEKEVLFREVPIEKLLAILLAYSGSKMVLVSTFKKAFPKSTKKSGEKYGFGKVILQMAGGKFGTHAETAHTNLYTFLEEFQDNIIAAAETKRKLNKP